MRFLTQYSLQNSLIFRSLFAAAAACSLIFGISGYLFVSHQSTKTFLDYEQNNNSILNITAGAVDIALWNLDEKQAYSQLKALEGTDGFCGARIVDKNGTVFSAFAWKNTPLTANEHIEKQNISFTTPNSVDDTTEVIGSLEICNNHDNIYAEISWQNKLLIMSLTITVFILLLIGFISAKIITSPLSKLGEAMESLKSGLKKIENPSLLQDNEIGQLGRQFNLMIDDLSIAHNALKEKINEAQIESEKNKLLSAIVSAANESGSGNEQNLLSRTIKYALDKSCEFWGWQLGHCYLLDTSDNLLKSSKLWASKDRSKYQRLINNSERISFAKDQGIPGTVWQNEKSLWLEEYEMLGKDFIRKEMLIEANLQSVFGFPIKIGNNLYGVLEFFSTDRTPKNDKIIDFMEVIGKQIAVSIERSRSQEALRSAKLKAEQASQAKSIFLSNMSHELRTPMHAVLNYSEMSLKQLEKGELDRIPKYLGNTLTAGKRLLSMLNDLLDLSKLEAGKMDINFTATSLVEISEYTIGELGSLLKQKELSVSLHNSATSDTVAGDRSRLIQVMVNLLSNAVKHSPEKETINIEISELQQQGKPLLLVNVKNKGEKIPEEDIEKIFEVFTQSENGKQVGGTGLGLAICREIIHAHGGEIWAKNTSDEVIFSFAIARDNKTKNKV